MGIVPHDHNQKYRPKPQPCHTLPLSSMQARAMPAARAPVVPVTCPYPSGGHVQPVSTQVGDVEDQRRADRPVGDHELPGSNPALPSSHHAGRGRETNTACAQTNDMLRAAKLPPTRGDSVLMDLPVSINYCEQPAGLGLRFPPNIDPLSNRGTTPTVPL